jgi:hypothetical protein
LYFRSSLPGGSKKTVVGRIIIGWLKRLALYGLIILHGFCGVIGGMYLSFIGFETGWALLYSFMAVSVLGVLAIETIFRGTWR